MLDHLKRLLKGSAIYGIGNALNQFINLLLLPLFTSYLSPADYGVTSILSMFTLVIYSIFTLGFGTSIGLAYFHTKDADTKLQVISTSLIILIISGLLAVFTGLTFVDQISMLLFRSVQYSSFVILTIVTTFFMMVIVPLTLRLQFEERQTQFVILTIISTIINIGLNVLLIVFLKRGLNGRVEAIMYASIASFLIYLLPLRVRIKMPFKFALAKELIRYGVPLIPSFIALYILQQGNIYLLRNYSTLENVGLFSIGYSFSSAILIVFSAFNTAWFPFAMTFEDKREEGAYLFGRVFTYYVIVAGLLSGLFYLFAYPVVKLFTQPEFQSAYSVIGLNSTAFCLLPAFSIIIIPLYFTKKVRLLIIFQIISALAFILAGLFLIPHFGILGAAINMIIGYFVMVLAAYYWCGRSCKEFKIIYEWKRTIPILFIYSLFILSSMIVKTPISSVIVHLIIIVLLMLSSYLILYKSEKQILHHTILMILSRGRVSTTSQPKQQ